MSKAIGSNAAGWFRYLFLWPNHWKVLRSSFFLFLLHCDGLLEREDAFSSWPNTLMLGVLWPLKSCSHVERDYPTVNARDSSGTSCVATMATCSNNSQFNYIAKNWEHHSCLPIYVRSSDTFRLINTSPRLEMISYQQWLSQHFQISCHVVPISSHLVLPILLPYCPRNLAMPWSGFEGFRPSDGSRIWRRSRASTASGSARWAEWVVAHMSSLSYHGCNNVAYISMICCLMLKFFDFCWYHFISSYIVLYHLTSQYIIVYHQFCKNDHPGVRLLSHSRLWRSIISCRFLGILLYLN